MKRFALLLALTLTISAFAESNEPSPCYFYYKVGGGVTSTGREGQGAIGSSLGFRYHKRFGWDIALGGLVSVSDHRDDSIATLRTLGLFYLTPKRPSSFYLGAGLGLGGRFAGRRYASTSGAYGLFGEFVLGHEWLFHRPTRALVRDGEGCCYRRVGLPLRLFAEVSVSQPAVVDRRDSATYHPAISLQVGIGI